MIHRPWDQWQWNGRVHTPFCPPRKANLLKDLWNFLSFFPGSHNTCWHQMTWCPPPHFTESVPLKTTSKLLVVKPSANPSIIFLPDLPATFFTNPLLLYLHGPRLFWPPLSPTVGFFFLLCPLACPSPWPYTILLGHLLSLEGRLFLWQCFRKADHLPPRWTKHSHLTFI